MNNSNPTSSPSPANAYQPSSSANQSLVNYSSVSLRTTNAPNKVAFKISMADVNTNEEGEQMAVSASQTTTRVTQERDRIDFEQILHRCYKSFNIDRSLNERYALQSEDTRRDII
jgi:hypothetical protein